LRGWRLPPAETRAALDSQLKILRFGLSDDRFGNLAREQRSWFLAQQRLEAETGEPWETSFAAAWPSQSLAEDVERAVVSERPDLVVFCCAAFWVSYPSAPLRLRRSNFPGSRQLSRLGFWMATKPLVADRAVFHAGRRIATGVSLTAFYVEPDAAMAHVERAIRAILRHEEVSLAVRGPLPLHIAGSPAVRAVCERRRAAFDGQLRDLCNSLHVEYLPFGPEDTHPPDELLGDRIHVNAKGHARRGEHEFDVMSRAWKAHTAPVRG
jgi:hypothetical protein